MKPFETPLKLPFRRGPVEYSAGSEADHEAVYQTLLHVFHGPDRESFLGALGEPAYRPEQRLLVKVDGRVASHVHLTERTMRLASAKVSMNGVMWVGTLPEYRGLGFAQNLLRLAGTQAEAKGVVVQTLTTTMPQFYRPLGWGDCGRAVIGVCPGRSLPAVGDGFVEAKGGGVWQVRPWRQVELGDLMTLYDNQYSQTTGSIVRTEEYWRWMIGRRYAHVIWVACLGERVCGYAFVKDHKILEIAFDPEYPTSLKALLGRVRAEALERAYPEVVIHAPGDHPVMAAVEDAQGRILDQQDWDGSTPMYRVIDPEGLLKALAPEFTARARASGADLPLEIGFTIGETKLLLHVESAIARFRIEADKLGRRHITLSESAASRLFLGHHDIDAAIEKDGAEASTATAIDTARILFPVRPIWRSPLDSATA